LPSALYQPIQAGEMFKSEAEKRDWANHEPREKAKTPKQNKAKREGAIHGL